MLMQLLCSTNSPALATDHAAFAEAGQTLIWRPIIPTAKENPTQTGLAEHETSAQLGEHAKIKADGQGRDFVQQKAECTRQYMSISSTAQHRDWRVQPVVQRSRKSDLYWCLLVVP